MSNKITTWLEDDVVRECIHIDREKMPRTVNVYRIHREREAELLLKYKAGYVLGSLNVTIHVEEICPNDKFTVEYTYKLNDRPTSEDIQAHEAYLKKE